MNEELNSFSEVICCMCVDKKARKRLLKMAMRSTLTGKQKVDHISSVIMVDIIQKAVSVQMTLSCSKKEKLSLSSGKHVREIKTPLNPTLIYLNWSIHGYIYFSYF